MSLAQREPFFPGVLVVPEGEVARATWSAERALSLSTFRARLRGYLSPELELADAAAVRVALAEVALGVVEGDPWLGPIARRGGRAWLRVLDGLDEALGVLADRRDALLAVARGRDGVAMRARLLGSLARAHERALEGARLVDPRHEAERAAALVAHADPRDVAAALSATSVRTRGIVEWTASDLALVRAVDASLSRLGGRAAVELPVFERPLDAERSRDPLDTVIEAVAAALDDAPLTTPIASFLSDVSSPALDRGATRVEVRQAIGADAQGSAVADAVHAALMEGVPPGRVVVALASDDDGSAREIVRAMDDAEIPVADLRGVRARSSNLVAFADLALDVAERGSRREDVALLLRSPYVDPRALLGQDEADAGGRALRDLARALSETPTAHGATPAERLAATVMTSHLGRRRGAVALGQGALRVGQSLARVADAATRVEMVRAARALFRDLGLGRDPSPSASLSAPASASRIDLADLAARARDVEAWLALTSVLGSYEAAALRLGVGDRPVTLEAFRHEIAWLYGRWAPPAGSDLARVRLVRLRELAAGDAHVVVVADADAEAWPDGRLRAGLVPVDLADRMAEASDPALRPILEAGAAPSIARLALGTSSATRVVFTYRARDDDGGGRSPAPVVASLGPRAATSVWRANAVPPRPLSSRDWVFGELLRRRDSARTLVPDVARRALLEERREESFGVEITAAHPLGATLPRGEPFVSILTEETGGGARPVAASSLDVIASCVFRGFASELLRPRQGREAHDVADSREVGHIVHAGLEEAFRATSSLWSARPRDRGEILRMGLAAADRVLARGELASDLARVAVDQARESVRAVLEWSIADLAWDFALAEQVFGEEGGWEPVVLEREGVRLAVRGRIDRVDLAHDSGGVRVIDYKTRERSAEAHTTAFGTTKFQLALYARAAEAGLARARGEGVYLATQRLSPGSLPRNHREKWAEAHEPVGEAGVPRFERRLLSLVTELRRGDVSVRPSSPGVCVHCDLDGICRKPRFAAGAPADDPLGGDEAR